MKKEDLIIQLKEYAGMDETASIKDLIDKDSIDSINKVGMIVLLEEYTHGDISLVELFECETIEDILDMVERIK